MTYRHANSLRLSLVLLAGLWFAGIAEAQQITPEIPPPAAPAPASTNATLRHKAAASPATKVSEQPSRPAVLPVNISQDTRPTLDPATFINTMRAAWTYKRIAEAGGWPTLPPGTVLKAGDKSPLVAVLRQRLALEGDLPAGSTANTVFDGELSEAVKRFQARHGLPETGAVRARTLQAINVPALTRHRQLTASAQRLAGSTFAFGDRYVVVNIPSAAVEAVERGEVVRRYVAVVGKTDRPSPTVETRITAVNLNPTWTVPVSLIRKDIIPHVRKDPAYLEKMKIRILDAKGQEVDPKTLDWSTESAVNYTLRQDSGAINSLGQIRIDMPNKHAVYMHDTPKKQLFAQDARFHSSGCVRVADVVGFAEWLLRDTGGASGKWTKSSIDAAIASTERQDIRLSKPVPVAWVYLTGYATPDGMVHFRDDVYGLDEPKADPSLDLQAVDVPATASIKSKRL
ncbi:L,D-transpeptidase family protein [Microvirga arsenatis]|uniref:L,D-transpeptidase family protein n=1 Tax=Microvirga arsenatis TaxID=2692265 RepID=A0ABW9YV21_9HYPH|nr:L,D-transpeptidase family protein [Microvirga arsenatis]NBJ10854.1 L,D-transpeptidase family protein [Microvirga arsenatis]NBJ24248.1 L,D-transpeptidase family protein [Microvirga arsenatis]